MGEYTEGMAERSLAVVAVIALVGCSTGGPQVKTAPVEIEEPFPEQQKLETIEEKERPTSYFDDRRTHVESWKMKGPLPDEVGPRSMSPDTPWERILDEQIDSIGDDAMATDGMNCLARQLGEFYLEHDAFPSGSLRVFLRSRCGVTAGAYHKRVWTWERSPKASVERLADHWKANQAGALQNFSQIEHPSAGIWYGEDDDGAVLVAPVGTRRVELEKTPIRTKAGESIVLEGKMQRDYARIQAVHTRGTYGHGTCEVDDSVEAPTFRVECPVDAGEPYTQVDVSIYPSDRALGQLVISNAFWREDVESRTFRPTEASRAVAEGYEQVFGESDDAPDMARSSRKGDSDADAGSGEEESAESETGSEESGENSVGDDGGRGSAGTMDERKFVELVNAVRRRADLETLSFERAQTQTARRLTGRYFRARFVEPDPELAEEIALGMAAGWRVRAPIVSASFSSRAVQSGHPEVLLERMLSTPSGRNILLGDQYRRIAVGLASPREGEALGAMVTVYRELPDESPHQRARRALEAINDAREDFGAAPIERDNSLNTKIAELSRKVESNQIDLQKAQRQLITVASQLWKTRVQLVGMISRSLDRVELHGRLEEAAVERAAVMVVPYRPEEAAWTSYVIFLVHPGSAETMAKGTEPSRWSANRKGTGSVRKSGSAPQASSLLLPRSLRYLGFVSTGRPRMSGPRAP